MLAAIPLLSLPVAVYVFFVLVLDGGGPLQTAHVRLTDPLLQLGFGAGGGWPVSVADILVAIALIVMFVELLKPPHGRRLAVSNHVLTLLLFVGCLTALLLFPPFATSTFLLITLMILLDVVAGFILTFSTSGDDGL